jgi:hypothetical protein
MKTYVVLHLISSTNVSLKFKDELQVSFEKKELGEVICENENEMDFG